MRAVGGVLYLTGVLVGVYNIIKTVSVGSKVEDELAEEILTNAYEPGDVILLKLKDDKIVFEKSALEAINTK